MTINLVISLDYVKNNYELYRLINSNNNNKLLWK